LINVSNDKSSYESKHAKVVIPVPNLAEKLEFTSLARQTGRPLGVPEVAIDAERLDLTSKERCFGANAGLQEATS
jgi:hypothetical protein